MNLPVLAYRSPALCSFFVSFLYQNFLAALAGWQSSVWLFLYNFLNSDLFFLHEGDALFPVLCQLSLILWTVFQYLIYCRVRTVPAYPSSDGSRECLCELELCLWHYLEYLCTDLFMKNWRELAKIESFCHFLAVLPSPVMCISVLALILGHVLKFWTWNPYFFLGNRNFQVWHIEMETKKSPLLEWQSKKKSPPKALCDSVLPGGKSPQAVFWEPEFVGSAVRGEGGIWCVLEDSSFSSSLKCCWSQGGNICTNFQGLMPQGTAFDGFNLHFLVCDK